VHLFALLSCSTIIQSDYVLSCCLNKILCKWKYEQLAIHTPTAKELRIAAGATSAAATRSSGSWSVEG